MRSVRRHVLREEGEPFLRRLPNGTEIELGDYIVLDPSGAFSGWRAASFRAYFTPLPSIVEF